MTSPFALIRGLLISALVLPSLTIAQTVNLTVNANQTVRSAPVDERIFGLNATCWDPYAGTPQTISLLQAAGTRTIRIPGGSLSDEYHWRTNKTLTNTWTWASGFDKYIDLITGLNAQAFVTVNYGTGTPEEAAAWVAYANAPANILGTSSDVAIGVDSKGYDWKTAGYWSTLRNSAKLATDDGMNFLRISRVSPLGLKYWEIGNENYGTWESDEQSVKNDPYTYAIRTKVYWAKMKAVDPTIKIGVVSQPKETDNVNNTSHPATNPRTGVVRNGWTPVMLTTLKAAPALTPDYLIYHRYDQAPAADQPGNPETDAGLLQKSKTWPTDASDLRQQLKDYLGAAEAAKVELTVTENNSVYGKPGKQTTSLVNGLFYADSIGNLLQTEFNSLLWWDLRNGQDNANNLSPSLYGWRQYGDYGVLSSPSNFGSTTAYDPYPTYYVMKLLANFTRGGDTVVSAASNNTLLSIFAVRRANGSLGLLVINKSPTLTQNASIAVTGYTPGATATTYTYGKPQDTAAQTGNGSTDIATSSMSIGGSTFSASFESYSVTVISLNNFTQIPAFTTQPSSQTVLLGSPATFTAVARGTPAPTYQWTKGGVAIAGATGSSYTISNTVLADAATYSVVASNSVGSVTSTGAVLTVNSAPIVAQVPVGEVVAPAQNAAFTISVSASPAPSGFQWQRLPAGSATWANLNDGGAYSGTNTATLYISNAQLAMNGDQFRCIVTNSIGSTTSAPATLTAAIPTTWARSVLLMNRTTVSSEVSLGDLAPAWRMTAAGDFNGDGKADIIWQNIVTGEHTLWLMNGTTRTATVDLGTTNPTWLIAGTGDFNGDGSPDILWQNVATGQHSIWLMSGTINIGNIELGTTDPIWRMTGTGDFNGDGQTDILWQNVVTGQHSIWLMSGTTNIGNIELGTIDPVWRIPGTGDFNGDGQTDILWQNTITGQMSLWLMNGTTVIGASDFGPADPSTQAAGVGDFNADGKVDVLLQKKIDIRNDLNGDGFTDILWQNTSTGQHSVWLMNGTTYLNNTELSTTTPVWQIAGTGDFNRDGQTDILWHNLLTGQHSVWLMKGATYQSGVDFETTDPLWQIAGTGDFNGDGQTDILFQNVTTGQRTIWLMTGTTHDSTVDLGITAVAWQIAGTGDFNADGHTDILWQNTVTGQHTLWLMTGVVNTGTVDLGLTLPIWQMVATGDFNGDGSTDILWQNTVTGQHSVWLMNGTTVSGNIELGTTSPDWQIVN